MSIELMPVGCARAVSRAFCVAAFSASSSCHSLLAAFFKSLLASLARAWARSACLCSGGGVVVVDWLGVDCMGIFLVLFENREPKRLLVGTRVFP